MTEASESKARCYGIAALLMAMVNIGLVAGLLLVLSGLDDPLAFSENRLLALIGSGVVALALVLTVVLLVFAIESMNLFWKRRARGPTSAIIAFCLGTMFAATFASLGGPAAIEHASARAGKEEAVSVAPSEAPLRQWQIISCDFLRELLRLVHRARECCYGPDHPPSGRQGPDSRRSTATVWDRVP